MMIITYLSIIPPNLPIPRTPSQYRRRAVREPGTLGCRVAPRPRTRIHAIIVRAGDSRAARSDAAVAAQAVQVVDLVDDAVGVGGDVGEDVAVDVLCRREGGGG